MHLFICFFVTESILFVRKLRLQTRVLNLGLPGYVSYTLLLSHTRPWPFYRISPNKCSGSYAKYKYGTFILCPICTTKSLSNFVFHCVLEVVKTKYKPKLKIIIFSEFFKYCYFNKYSRFQDNKIIVTQKLKFILGKVKNIVGKGENADYQHFLLFPQCRLQFLSIWTSLKFCSLVMG